jgi:hypothetical protein
MAQARMLHKKISISGDVNKLSLPAKLLFTWMIPHADDEGRLAGNPNLVRATVVPLGKWSLTTIKKLIIEIKNQGLIYYWEENKDYFIEFVNWNRYQAIRKKRFHPSVLPSFDSKYDDQTSSKRLTNDVQVTSQYNAIELNKIKVNKSEDGNIANKIFPSKESAQKFSPNNFSPSNESEQAAFDIWNQLEPNNPGSFRFYLWAAKQGLPSYKFYEFASEIKQDDSIKSKGAVFNKKVTDYLGGNK